MMNKTSFRKRELVEGRFRFKRVYEVEFYINLVIIELIEIFQKDIMILEKISV